MHPDAKGHKDSTNPLILILSAYHMEQEEGHHGEAWPLIYHQGQRIKGHEGE